MVSHPYEIRRTQYKIVWYKAIITRFSRVEPCRKKIFEPVKEMDSMGSSQPDSRTIAERHRSKYQEATDDYQTVNIPVVSEFA